MKTKKVPMRRCAGCMVSRPKKELIRIAAAKDGSVHTDLTGKAQGRGVYLCRDPECLNRAKKRRSVSKSLGVSISDEKLEEMFNCGLK